MEVFNWNAEEEKNRQSVLAWTLIQLMTEAFSPKKFDKADTTKLELECRINGVEVSMVKLIERLHTNYDQIVRDDAKKLVKSLFGELEGAIYRAQEVIDDVIDKG